MQKGMHQCCTYFNHVGLNVRHIDFRNLLLIRSVCVWWLSIYRAGRVYWQTDDVWMCSESHLRTEISVNDLCLQLRVAHDCAYFIRSWRLLNSLQSMLQGWSLL